MGGIGFDELVGGPGDGIRLARSRRMLNEIAMPYPMGGRMAQQSADDVQLVVPREDECFLGQRVGALAFEEREMLDDAHKALARENFFPEIGCFVAVGVGRIPFAFVVAFVEGQEKGVRPREFGGHVHLVRRRHRDREARRGARPRAPADLLRQPRLPLP